MTFKPHRKSNHPVNDKHTLYDDYSIYTPFTPAQPKKGGMPPDDTTTQDNKTPPKHEPEDEQTKPQTPIIPLAFEPTRYVIHVHALKAPIGESAVVAIQCGKKGKYNNNNNFSTVMPVYDGGNVVYLNKIPEETNKIENRVALQVNYPTQLSNFPGLNLSGFKVAGSNIGFNGEYEHSQPNVVYYLKYANERLALSSSNLGGTTLDTFTLGKGIPLRTIAFSRENCLNGVSTVPYDGTTIYTRTGYVDIGTSSYEILDFKVVRVSGTARYQGACSSEHECYIHLAETQENEEIIATGTASLTVTTTEEIQLLNRDHLYSLYHIYLNWLGVIEYLGSLWVKDPALPVVHISRDNEDGLEVIITSPGISQHKTKYASAEYPATADFTNSFNTITISQPTAQTTVTYASNIIQWLTNDDSSQSKYYGLSELGYSALVVAAASVV
jgi:hypothetical protein